jgi:hypothetical protein
MIMFKKFVQVFVEIGKIFFSPGKTLGRSMQEKRYLGTLIVILLISFILNFITLPEEMSIKAEIFRNSEVSEILSDEQLSGMANPSAGLKAFLAFWRVFILLLKISIMAFFLFLLYGISGADGIYLNYFTLAAGGSIIGNVLPQILYAFSSLTHVNLIQFTRSVFLLPSLNPKSLTYLFLIQFDLFSFWYLIVVGMGVSVFSTMSIKKSVSVSLILILFKSIVIALFSYLTLKITGI